MLTNKTDQIDFSALIGQYPWILQREVNCILSPDSDGLLCGLLMSHFLGWRVVGFYDGKVLALKEGVSCYDPATAFLDIEIYRSGVRSVGHHMLLVNQRHIPEKWENGFANCIQPNLMREHDFTRFFRLKYPLATVHLLLAILGSRFRIEIGKHAIAPLFFTDGVFNVLYRYPENVLNWLQYLRADEEWSPLRQLFMNEHYTVYETMIEMDGFFRARDTLSVRGSRGDKFTISDSAGRPSGFVERHDGRSDVDERSQKKVQSFLALLAETTGWEYRPSQWTFTGLNVVAFEKSSFQNRGWKINNRDFQQFMTERPLSWAIESANTLEFTLERPQRLP